MSKAQEYLRTKLYPYLRTYWDLVPADELNMFVRHDIPDIASFAARQCVEGPCLPKEQTDHALWWVLCAMRRRSWATATEGTPVAVDYFLSFEEAWITIWEKEIDRHIYRAEEAAAQRQRRKDGYAGRA